jgi:predicted O-methyltransferase YrrM
VRETRTALRLISQAPTDQGEAFDFIRRFESGRLVLGLWQIKGEFVQLLDRLQELGPRSVLEIGTGRGGSLFFFARMTADEGTIVTVDLEGSAFGGGYRKEYARLLRSFARHAQRLELVRGDSHSRAVRDRVRELVRDSVDFLFIDGDHTYEGVSADYTAYAPLVRPGGLIALHDIVPGPEDAVGGVPEFWQELRRDHTTEEIVEDWAQGGYGIGLVHVD